MVDPLDRVHELLEERAKAREELEATRAERDYYKSQAASWEARYEEEAHGAQRTVEVVLALAGVAAIGGLVLDLLGAF